MAREPTGDPFLAFNFTVAFGPEIQLGGFSEVTGLQAEIEFHDYREGGVNEYVHKFVGPVKYSSNLILKRGLVHRSVSHWFWRISQEGLNGNRVNATVLMRNNEAEPVVEWIFKDTYPVKWSGPELRADSNSVAVESLELAHRGILSVTEL